MPPTITRTVKEIRANLGNYLALREKEEGATWIEVGYLAKGGGFDDFFDILKTDLQGGSETANEGTRHVNIIGILAQSSKAVMSLPDWAKGKELEVCWNNGVLGNGKTQIIYIPTCKANFATKHKDGDNPVKSDANITGSDSGALATVDNTGLPDLGVPEGTYVGENNFYVIIEEVLTPVV
jgi:hypothetical protein